MKNLDYKTQENLEKFQEEKTPIRYKNPYSHKNSNGFIVEKPDECVDNPILYRVEFNGNIGVLVYRHNHNDYVVNGVMVSQRIGGSIELLEAFTKENIQPFDIKTTYEIIKGLVETQEG